MPCAIRTRARHPYTAAMPSADEDQLAELEKEQKRLVQRTKRLADKFVSAAGRFAADWIGEHVREVVGRQHEHARDTYELAEMKAETSAAQAAAPMRTWTALQDLPWVYRETPDQRARGTPTRSIREESPMVLHSAGLATHPVDEPLRRVLGQAEGILRQHGYRDEGSDWEDPRPDGGAYRLRSGFVLSDEVRAALDAAATSDTEVLKLGQKIGALKDRIAEARARAAWDEA